MTVLTVVVPPQQLNIRRSCPDHALNTIVAMITAFLVLLLWDITPCHTSVPCNFTRSFRSLPGSRISSYTWDKAGCDNILSVHSESRRSLHNVFSTFMRHPRSAGTPSTMTTLVPPLRLLPMNTPSIWVTTTNTPALTKEAPPRPSRKWT